MDICPVITDLGRKFLGVNHPLVSDDMTHETVVTRPVPTVEMAQTAAKLYKQTPAPVPPYCHAGDKFQIAE